MSSTILNIGLEQEVWVAGKGPSFDYYPWHKVGQVIGINETALLIPNCWGAAATEYSVLKYYTRHLDDNVYVINQKANPMVFFKRQVIWEPGKQVRKVKGGTVNLLVEVLGYYGVKKIHFVGFDSLDRDFSFSRQIAKLQVFQSDVRNYEEIMECLLETLEYTGIEPVWEHRNV